MTVRLAFAVLLVATRLQAGGMMLAGETVRFDRSLRPLFTENQIRNSSEAVRAGLTLWSATEHGQRFIARFMRRDYGITISEDRTENGPGRAPQPGIAVLAASRDRSKQKSYELILNPAFIRLPRDTTPALWKQPVTPAEVMATAWAAEMLHIYFYSKGISLPHHTRSDFQDEWRAMARELGFPDMRHDDEDVELSE